MNEPGSHVPDRMKKIPETKASMVRWGRMCPMLFSTKPMNMKNKLTSGNGVAERIISAQKPETSLDFIQPNKPKIGMFST